MNYTTQTPNTDTRITLTAPYTHDMWKMNPEYVRSLIMSSKVHGTGAGKGWTIRL